MIPTPRPGPMPGDCPDCGRAHDGECHLAEMERNREVPESSCFFLGKPIRDLDTEERGMLREFVAETMAGRPWPK